MFYHGQLILEFNHLVISQSKQKDSAGHSNNFCSGRCTNVYGKKSRVVRTSVRGVERRKISSQTSAGARLSYMELQDEPSVGMSSVAAYKRLRLCAFSYK